MFERVLRPRIRTVLLIVNLAILALPLAGIAGLRLYENELIRGTEAQLLLQGTLVREMFLLAYRDAADTGLTVDPLPPADPLRDALVPTLDIRFDAPQPPAPPAEGATAPADPAAAAAGRGIQTSLRSAARESLVGIRVTDARGIVVASTGSELGLSLAAREEVAGALAGMTASLLRKRSPDGPQPELASISRGQRYRVFVALPIRDGSRVVGAVVLSRTPLDIGKGLWIHRKPIVVGGLAVVGVVMLVTVLTSLTISRPLQALVEQARRVARGDRGALASPRGPRTREVAQLWVAVEEMARTLEERADYIRAFASHVSHEFKTPLTTLRGSLELLRDHLETMSREERVRFLGNAEDAAARLDRLVRRLLDLARADVAAPGDDRAELGPVIDAAVERYARAGTSVTPAVERDTGSVAMSSEILDEILTNLIDNARQHGGDGVSVRIGAGRATGSAARQITLLVEDDGPGVSEANLSRIFTPFFTTARERGGSGLGLSIVRSLLQAHGGSIDYVAGRAGASFRVTIPAAGPR